MKISQLAVRSLEPEEEEISFEPESEVPYEDLVVEAEEEAPEETVPPLPRAAVTTPDIPPLGLGTWNKGDSLPPLAMPTRPPVSLHPLDD